MHVLIGSEHRSIYSNKGKLKGGLSLVEGVCYSSAPVARGNRRGLLPEPGVWRGRRWGAGSGWKIELKSLILAQIERWRHALHMQVERQRGATLAASGERVSNTSERAQ
jgi:hypothetical protein